MDVLDNPVWHALSGPQRALAEGSDQAMRYQPEVTLFAALPDHPTGASWDALGALIGRRGTAALVRPDPFDLPAGWETIFRRPAVQMIGSAAQARTDVAADVLGPDDVPEMLALVERTRPGPFGVRTIQLGTYLGRRDGGQLVAMAGERMRLAGYAEISAVCTDPTHRGRGYASALVGAVVDNLTRAGLVPILHVAADNVGAIRLYEQLGFVLRRQFEVVGLRAPAR